ncbi:unnamed protein product [Dracunculus medinensis]|uniref:BCAS3 WD40 domain-containing protein n=1 Tax=Dracunculus medinensis TaxID=318479 RepID=A0A3P7STB2_DRAME|nr:unnamed protein product [Dracunculus medinensis]
MVVAFAKYIKICDMMTLHEQYGLYNCQIRDGIPVPFAVSDILIAYATSSVISDFDYHIHISLMNSSSICFLKLDGSFVLAHFVAHTEAVSFIAFANGGRLLLTADLNCYGFSTFLLHSFAVRHLYTLQRGTTPAKTLHCAFSLDNRWVAVTTNHGTTHIFAICPNGGQATLRTHHRFSKRRSSKYLNFVYYPFILLFAMTFIYFYCREHPSLSQIPLVRAVKNPRIGPFPKPLSLYATCKLGVSFFLYRLFFLYFELL